MIKGTSAARTRGISQSGDHVHIHADLHAQIAYIHYVHIHAGPIRTSTIFTPYLTMSQPVHTYELCLSILRVVFAGGGPPTLSKTV